jgi:transcriptional regulator with XRE-family HTH domain
MKSSNEQQFELTPPVCRAARGLIGYSQSELAKRSNLAPQTIADFERGARIPLPNNLAAMQRALETAGVVFVPSNGDGPGVRLRKENL